VPAEVNLAHSGFFGEQKKMCVYILCWTVPNYMEVSINSSDAFTF